MTTGEMLDFLAQIGAPSVRRFDDGSWSAKVAFPAPKGVTTEVSSDFNHPTHESALTEVIARASATQVLIGADRR